MEIKRYLDESGLTLVWHKITGLTTAIDNKVTALTQDVSTLSGSVATLSGSVVSNYYTSAKTDEQIKNAVAGIKSDMASVFSFKGTKDTIEDLPESGNTTGDVWHVLNGGTGKTNAEYVWNGTAWEELGTTVDLSGYQENLSWTVTGQGNTVVSIAQSGADNQNITVTKGYLVSSVTVDGTGNAVTTASVTNGELTLSKGKTFSETGHKHVAADITDFDTSVDARIKLEKVKVNGTALSIADDKSVNVLVAEGATNGTIAVNGTDFAVHGLGSAAFTESSAYATAAQGALADTALQPADIDAIKAETINRICQ